MEKEKRELPDVARQIYALMTSVFICVILGIFPLYYHDYYFDILTAKYKFYWITVIVYLSACLIAALVFAFIDCMEYKGEHTRAFLKHFRVEQLKKQPLAYKALFLFWVFCVISTLQSDYVYESFWGNEGRFSGLFLMTLYALGTVLAAKLGEIKRWHLDLFLLVSLLICLFGITDYFRMDLLGWKANVKSSQGDSFTSTLGNVNTYTAYVGIVLGVSGSLFVKEKNLFRSIWYYVLSAVGFVAIIMGQSDNAYLALAMLFVVLPFFVYKNTKEISRYAVLAATFFTSFKLVEVLSRRFADTVIGFSGVVKVLGGSSLMFPLIVLVWGIAVGFWYLSGRQTEESQKRLGEGLKKIWIVLLAVLFLLVTVVLVDANLLGHADRYASFSQYVVFNDEWGTKRGFAWRAAWESYVKLPLLHLLFGYGPDTFGILTWDYRETAIELYDFYFESAHNEFLQYLVTMGPFALLCYLTFLGGAVCRMAKNASIHPAAIACLMAVLCYNAQALVNINLPIATPIMWMMIGMGLALCREKTAS